jgi:hypothetical protein
MLSWVSELEVCLIWTTTFEGCLLIVGKSWELVRTIIVVNLMVLVKACDVLTWVIEAISVNNKIGKCVSLMMEG